MTSMCKYTLEQDELEKEYIGLYTSGQMIMDSIYGQISYNCSLSKAFKLKLGHNPKIFLFKIRRGTWKEIAKHRIRPTKIISASRVKARCAQLRTIIHRPWMVLKKMEERRERRMVGKRIILVLM